MILIDLIGYSAGIFTLVNMIPQLHKTITTKKVSDISWWMMISYVASMVLWVTYAVFIVSWPIIITNSIAGILGLVQLGLMLKYR